MKIMFMLAHPDDEAYGPAGTIAKLAVDNEVVIISLCNGARPGNEHVEEVRTTAFKESCAILGADWRIYNNNDCTLTYADTLAHIEMLIDHFKPDVVYTHNVSDIHRDHSLIAECCLVACRPKLGSTVNELYFFEIPSSTAWSFGQLSPVFTPNVYQEIDIDVKKKSLSLYTTETYNFPDARSIEAVETLAKYRGYQSGVNYAEAFQLVFSRNRSN